MISVSSSIRGLARVRLGRILAFAVFLGLGIAVSHPSALAGVAGSREGRVPASLANDARSAGESVVAENKNWNRNGNRNWDKGEGNYNNKNWSNNNNKNWSKNWGHYNNHWNKNWNQRAYVRGWSRRPYYGDFVGGVILGSILAAAGAGVVPYAPEPYLCWYWADPYMYRGYWDYCY